MNTQNTNTQTDRQTEQPALTEAEQKQIEQLLRRLDCIERQAQRLMIQTELMGIELRNDTRPKSRRNV